MPKLYSKELKESVIRYYKSNDFTINNTINIFSISKSSLYNWIEHYTNNNLQNINNIRTTYITKFSKENDNNISIRKYIVNYILKRQTNFTIKNLRKNITRIFNVTIGKSRVYEILNEEKISYKKISNKIVHKNVKHMKIKVKELKKEIQSSDSNNVISIDESSFDTNLRKIKGWNVKGKKVIKECKDSQRKRLTLILGISKNNITGYKLIDGSANKISFEDFLTKDILSKIGNEKSHKLLLDNARIHHALNIKTLVSNTKHKLVYNVPYNPETNPIEFIFGIIKQKMRNENNSTSKQLKSNLVKIIKLIKKEQLTNTFYHSLQI